MKPTFDEMTEKEFMQTMEAYINRDVDAVPVDTFFEWLANVERTRAEEVIEMTVSVQGNQVALQGPEGLVIQGNELVLGNRRLVFKAASPAV